MLELVNRGFVWSTEAASDCGASEGAASTTKVVVEEGAVGGREERPKHLDLLPPPPRKEGKRSPQVIIFFLTWSESPLSDQFSDTNLFELKFKNLLFTDNRFKSRDALTSSRILLQ